jgi:histidyl-tRNA synthetase
VKKLTKLSGFPEWLPQERLAEIQLIDTIEEIYLSHGFCSIETPAVELFEHLTENGVVAREMYLLRRAQETAEDARDGEEGGLALHFDLTVPFARYVAQHLSSLTFPLKRYSLQKVWRGERPQKGRSREFYQFDIDIVSSGTLPLSCDAEIVAVIEKAFRRLALTSYTIRLNNRKVLQGFYESCGLSPEQRVQTITEVDKIDKIGREGVAKALCETVGVAGDIVEEILNLAQIKVSAADVVTQLAPIAARNDICAQGVAEIQEVLRLLPEGSREMIVVDLSLARGLGYYTGTIFEVHLPEYPQFGSACGGGRYENLTARFSSQNLPAVGASIGITRLMTLVLDQKLRATDRVSPADVLVTVYDEERRPQSNRVAENLRALGVKSEVFYKSPKLGKQIEYAEKKGIPYVLFIDPEISLCRVKDLRTKEQLDIDDLEIWVGKVFPTCRR